MYRPKYVICTVGTSIVTRGLAPEGRTLINRNANRPCNDQHIPAEFIDALEAGKIAVRNELRTFQYEVSAELSSLALIFDWQNRHAPSVNNGDQILFVITDTHVGHACADTIIEFLRGHNIPAERLAIKGLQADNIDELQDALAELTKRVNEIVQSYRGYDITFNLTGGFKSISGYLQQTATLLGVDSCYLFEQSRSLIRIPRMPITLDVAYFVDSPQRVATMRQIALELPVTDTDFADEMLRDAGVLFLPKNLVDTYALSAWGVVVWQRIKDIVYDKAVMPSPTTQLTFRNFKKFDGNVPKLKIQDVNETIDVLATYICKQVTPLASHKIKPVVGHAVISHEIYAWSDDAAGRIFFFEDPDAPNHWIIADDLRHL